MWNELAADGIDVHETPGDHDSFVLEPNVRHVVRELKAYLLRADPRRRPAQDYVSTGMRHEELTLVGA
jgi:thioesterase domain-containing protein